jgi:hypothetical protein
MKVASPHCVRADVSSDESSDEMTCYTHHMRMAEASVYELMYLKEGSSYSMTCYIHHMKVA